ncbi:MAG: helix-turn-helix domain-containing protein [Ignavibacteriaceae bacterium]
MGVDKNKENTIERQQRILETEIIPIMEKKEITKYRLSKLSGVSESTISLWFRGKNGIELSNFLKLCDALNIKKLNISK